MSFGSRLKEQRERMGMTQVQLAKLLGVSKGAVGNYEIGLSSPKADILYQVFDILKCDANYLFQDEMENLHQSGATPSEMENLIKKYRTLDRYGQDTVSAVLECEVRRCAAELREKQEKRPSVPPPPTGEGVRYIIPEYFGRVSAGSGQPAADERPENAHLTRQPPHGASYIAHISGDSMEPTYHDGDRVFVSAIVDISPGEVGVFLQGGEQYIKELGNGVLLSHNTKYPPIPLQDEIRCQGVVLGVCDNSYFEQPTGGLT